MIKFIYTFCILRNQFTFQLFIILASNVPLGVQIPRPLGQKEQARSCPVACCCIFDFIREAHPMEQNALRELAPRRLGVIEKRRA